MTNETAKRALENALPKIEEILEDRITSQGTPGLVAALFHEGEILYFKGLGHRELDGPAPEAGTAFRVASCTKSFTAAAILLLRDRELLTLDDPITKYLPRYHQVGPLDEVAPPTLRMLLSMSAGFGTDDPWADREESISPEQLEQHIANGVYLISIPGTRYEYSNLGYALLGRVVEVISGTSFPTFVTQEIFSPLGLGDSSFSVESSQAPNVAVGYRRRGDEWLAQEFSGPGSFSSIGGVFSSARDLAKWANWLCESLSASGKESGPLSLATRREFQEMHIPMPFSSGAATTSETMDRLFGYGFALHVDFDEKLGKFVSHSGGYPGYSAHMRWHAASGVGIVILENARYSGAWATATSILEAVLAQLPPTNPSLPTDALIEFVTRASTLIANWDDQLAGEICAPNVAMDIPYSERAEQIAHLINEIGGIQDAGSYEIETPQSPLHARWTISGVKGDLLCELRLIPVLPLKIQTLRVSVTKRT